MLTPIALLLNLAAGPAIQESAFHDPGVTDSAVESPLEGWIEEERTILRAHYQRVVRELLAANPALDAETMAARRRTIEGLRAYHEAGEFGRSLGQDQAGHRAFLFVDEAGRRCAVAELLHLWGEDDLVESVRESDNEAMVQELGNHPELVAWLDRVGLTLEEAIRIQGPGITVEVVDPPRPGPFVPGAEGSARTATRRSAPRPPARSHAPRWRRPRS